MSKLRIRILGKVSRGEVSPRLNEAEVKKSVLSFMVTFRETLLIKIYVMDVLDKWEVGNI